MLGHSIWNDPNDMKPSHLTPWVLLKYVQVSVSAKKTKSRKLYYFIVFRLEIMTIWSMDSFAWTWNRHVSCYFETAFTQLLSWVNIWKLK